MRSKRSNSVLNKLGLGSGKKSQQQQQPSSMYTPTIFVYLFLYYTYFYCLDLCCPCLYFPYSLSDCFETWLTKDLFTILWM